MPLERITEIVGPLCFFAGFFLGVSREPVRKKVFPNMPPERGTRTILTISILLLSIAIASFAFQVYANARRSPEREAPSAQGETSEGRQP